ncbi:hypothetical protein LL037_08050 [Clostridium estertheticum]|uniref:hypothetical protein n=1 Tax=Clostridium estertheticum TaxID=238834 RepID=UPI001C0BCEBD|nr:hypothetical protein [Clostridium estertheticum]MBU3199828.1 hypothetical protein [Clostridium estertheticum]WAG67071.1 hypothetical protein LL037_08050 [Clostridium estertheticum]
MFVNFKHDNLDLPGHKYVILKEKPKRIKEGKILKMDTKEFQKRSLVSIFFSYFKPHKNLFILDMSTNHWI